MEHPFIKLKPEYSQLLAAMIIRLECRSHVDEVATKILSFRSRFTEVTQATGVPMLFSGPSFYREADLNFALSPAQGDPWRRVSTHVPSGIGPYPSWIAAAIAAYHINHLDKVGAENWTWELLCFYAELFNGFGYRDFHKMHSPYLWGGTNIQTVGKYGTDGGKGFDATHMDQQIGVIPLARRLAEIDTTLVLAPPAIPVPMRSGLAVAADPKHDTIWLQGALAELGYDVAVDGNYGKQTRHVVAEFERAYGLKQDGGYAGPEVIGAVEKALAVLEEPA